MACQMKAVRTSSVETNMSGESDSVAKVFRMERELDGKARYAQTGGGCEPDGFCADDALLGVHLRLLVCY